MVFGLLQPFEYRGFVQQDLAPKSHNAPVEPVHFTVEQQMADSTLRGPFVLLAELGN